MPSPSDRELQPLPKALWPEVGGHPGTMWEGTPCLMKKADFRVGNRPAWWQGFSKAWPVCGEVSICDESHGMSCLSVLSLPQALFSLTDLASCLICS